MPEALRLRVGLDEGDLLLAATGHPQVAQGLVVDREDRDGRAVLRAHVADGRAVGQRDRRDALAVELDELADHAVLAQHLGDGQDQVGRGRALGQLAAELEADDLRDEHRHRLAEHRGLGLDAADAPAEHAEPVDHRGVRVGADQGVGVGDAVAVEDDAREVLDVDLVHDAGARRHHLELVEGGLPPAQELVALPVALVLQVDVALEGVRRAEEVGDDGVVDDQLGRRERVDRAGSPPSSCTASRIVARSTTHGTPVKSCITTRAGRELDLDVRLGLRVPRGERPDVVGGDVGAVLGAQQVLQQDLQREGQRGNLLAQLLDARPAGRSRSSTRRPRASPLAPKLSCVALATTVSSRPPFILPQRSRTGPAPGPSRAPLTRLSRHQDTSHQDETTQVHLDPRGPGRTMTRSTSAGRQGT